MSDPDPTRPVVVGVDGSKSAIRAARWAAGVANRFGAPLTIVSVKPRPCHNVSDDDDAALATAVADYSANILSAAQEAVSSHVRGLSLTTVAATDTVDAALTDASRKAHFLVLGCDDVKPGAPPRWHDQRRLPSPRTRIAPSSPGA